jgi:hypothetical protein
MDFMEGNIKIDFKDIKLNFYCIELGFLISRMVMYYQFMPEWIDWEMDGKFLIDKDNREIFVQDSANIKTVDILFHLINLEISENLVANCGIFDLEFNHFGYENNKKNGFSKDVLKKLKSIKKDFSFHVIVRNFGLKNYNYTEEVTKKNYYDKIYNESNYKYFESKMKSKKIKLLIRL